MHRPRPTQVARVALIVLATAPSLLGQASDAPAPCVDVGLVAAVHGNALTITNDAGTKTYKVDGKTKITRGGNVNLGKVRVGDDVMLWCKGDGSIATDILVNFTHWDGTVTAIHPHGFVISGKGGVGEAPGHVAVLVDANTSFVQGTRKDLKIGRGVEISGSIIAPKRVQATAVRIY